MEDALLRQRAFYDEHKEEYRKKYLGKYVLIYQNKLQGAFESVVPAYNYATQNGFKKDSFIIHEVTAEDKIARFAMPRF